MTRKILTLLVVGITAVLSGCTSTKVVSSWKSPEIQQGTMNKVLVLAMMTDREAKDNIEKVMISQLRARGVEVVTGTSEFGPRGFGNLTREQADAKLAAGGYTSVMIICLTDKDKQVDYVPGSPYISPYGHTYYGYWGRYRCGYDTVYSPGYFTTTTTYVLDADLYQLPEDKLVYSVQTKSYDPSDSRDLAESYSKEIIEALVSNGIL